MILRSMTYFFLIVFLHTLLGARVVNVRQALDAVSVCKEPPKEQRPEGMPNIEVHNDVRTDDGFMLTLWRVRGNNPKRVVLILSGFECSARDWFTGLDADALPWILFREGGYDVWIGNNRGTFNSINPHWDWNFMDMARYDMPAMMNYVLAEAKAESLAFIGHSQGALQALMHFSEDQESASRVSHVVALAPAVYLSVRRWTWDLLAGFRFDRFSPGVRRNTSFGAYESIMSAKCDIMCSDCMRDMGGSYMEGKKGFAPTCREKFKCIPAGTSSASVQTFAKVVRSGRKDGFAGYLEEKGSPLELKNIRAPLTVAVGRQDLFMTPENVERLVNESTGARRKPDFWLLGDLPSVPKEKGKKKMKVGHMDIVWGDQMPELLYRPLLQRMSFLALENECLATLKKLQHDAPGHAKVTEAVRETLTWLEANEDAERETLDRKQRELDIIVSSHF